MKQMGDSAATLVLKAASAIRPDLVPVPNSELAHTVEMMECRDETTCEVGADLMEWHEADEEELFFEVFMEESVQRANLDKKQLKMLLRKWGESEMVFFKSLTL